MLNLGLQKQLQQKKWAHPWSGIHQMSDVDMAQLGVSTRQTIKRG